jgi:hypothetical protein
VGLAAAPSAAASVENESIATSVGARHPTCSRRKPCVTPNPSGRLRAVVPPPRPRSPGRDGRRSGDPETDLEQGKVDR